MRRGGDGLVISRAKLQVQGKPRWFLFVVHSTPDKHGAEIGVLENAVSECCVAERMFQGDDKLTNARYRRRSAFRSARVFNCDPREGVAKRRASVGRSIVKGRVTHPENRFFFRFGSACARWMATPDR